MTPIVGGDMVRFYPFLAFKLEAKSRRRFLSHAAGETGTDFITERFEFRRGIGLHCSAVNHIHTERHVR